MSLLGICPGDVDTTCTDTSLHVNVDGNVVTSAKAEMLTSPSAGGRTGGRSDGVASGHKTEQTGCHLDGQGGGVLSQPGRFYGTMAQHREYLSTANDTVSDGYLRACEFCLNIKILSHTHTKGRRERESREGGGRTRAPGSPVPRQQQTLWGQTPGSTRAWPFSLRDSEKIA